MTVLARTFSNGPEIHEFLDAGGADLWRTLLGVEMGLLSVEQGAYRAALDAQSFEWLRDVAREQLKELARECECDNA